MISNLLILDTYKLLHRDPALRHSVVGRHWDLTWAGLLWQESYRHHGLQDQQDDTIAWLHCGPHRLCSGDDLLHSGYTHIHHPLPGDGCGGRWCGQGLGG